jgi:hypothetical protein
MDLRKQIDELLLMREQTVEPGHQPTIYMTCVEPAFLSTAFGPDTLNRDVSQEQFLEAFRVGGPAAQFGVPVSA